MADEGTVKVGMDQMLAQLEKVRQEHGDVAYNLACEGLAVSLITKPRGDEYIKKVLPHLDVEKIREKAKAQAAAGPATAPNTVEGSPQEVMGEALRANIPNLKTQAQYNVFTTAFDALRLHLNAVFGNDTENAAVTRKALLTTLDMAVQATEMAGKLAAEPDAVMSDEAKEHTEPPTEFMEYDIQKQLLVELHKLTTVADLNRWYEERKPTLDKVKSQSLRNALFDGIRQRKAALQVKENTN